MTFLTAGLLLAAAWPAASPELPAPVLHCYSRPTQVGTVARREFKNAAGHVVKEIFYTGPTDAQGRPTCEDETLDVQSIRTYEHDIDGRPIIERVFGPDERMERQSRLEYGADDVRPVRRVTVDPAGMLRSETRWEAGEQVTVLHFDDDRRVALVTGRLPADVQYSIEWGPAFDGWACGVGMTRRQGLAEELAPAVHLQNLTAKDGMARFARRFDTALLDARGRLVKERALRTVETAGAPAHLLWPREATYHHGPDLRQRFGRLDPGRYRLLAWHPHPETGALLECGSLELVVKQAQIR